MIRAQPRSLLPFLAALLCLPAALAAQTGWTMDGVPRPGDAAWQRAAAAGVWWELAQGPKGLAVHASRPAARVQMGVRGGRLAASAGGLDWLPESGAALRLAEGPFNALGRRGSELYALSGSAGQGGGQGRLWKVEPASGAIPWQARWVVDLKEPGWTLCPASAGGLWVVTQTRLYRIDLAAKLIETVVDQAVWNGLRPISAVEIDGIVHIGMRGGVASVAPNARTLAWTERLAP